MTAAHVFVQAIDFLEKCLTFSPKRRITVIEALQHPYFEVCIYHPLNKTRLDLPLALP